LAIILTSDASPVISFDEKKNNVQRFYDELGWQKDEDESSFIDQVVFEDHRPVSQEYRLRCDLRVKRYLRPRGKFLLDVASGPIPRSEYLLYSEGYDFRICVDFSYKALMEAQRKLGDKALYVLGDITNLPLQDKCMDGVISLHTIYHVPADQQRMAFDEIYRVMKPGSSAVVVYSWGGRSFFERYPIRIMNAILDPLAHVVHKTKASLITGNQKPRRTLDQPLYAYMHSYRWFKQLYPMMNFDLAAWRSISVPFMTRYIRPLLLGRRLLALIYWLENTFPYVLGRLGAYPMFIIRK
jgi:ubiquinone/menaquinone biosynthesis C-methylase UbiE